MKESAKSRDVKAALSDTELSNMVRVSSGYSFVVLMLLETRHVTCNKELIFCYMAKRCHKKSVSLLHGRILKLVESMFEKFLPSLAPP